MAGQTEALARFICRTEFGRLPAHVVAEGKRHLLDSLGVGMAGASTEASAIAVRLVEEEGGSSEATLLANGRGTSAMNAAFANGMAIYSIGLNDTHRASMSHPGACVVPAALAVGEKVDAGGADLLAAVVVGYEVMGRVGRAVMPSHRERGFQATGTCGCFGAAAAAAKILGLDEEKTLWALGIAGTQAAGLYEFLTEGAMTMILHAGRAAQSGVLAALLAREGLTGPRHILEGSRGFGSAMADAFDPSALTEGLGERFEVGETSYRPACGCTSTLPAMEALMELPREARLSESVAAVKVRCAPQAAVDYAEKSPSSLVAARMSLPFAVAMVLREGDYPLREVEMDDLKDPLLLRLCGLVELIPTQGFTKQNIGVEVILRDGSRRAAEVQIPKGHPDNPLTEAEVKEKFRRLASPRLGEAGAERVQELVDRLEKASVRELVARSVGVAEAVSSP